MDNIVTVFGASYPKPGDEAWNTAYETGKVLGGLGYAVANGGYGGTMQASAQGAKDAGASTVGVTCDIWSSKPNQWIDRVINTTHLVERLTTLVDICDHGFVVLPGSTGTLLELAMVWEMMFKKMMPAKPIVCIGGFYDPLIEMMVRQRSESAGFVNTVNSPDELREFFPGV